MNAPWFLEKPNVFDSCGVGCSVMPFDTDWLIVSLKSSFSSVIFCRLALSDTERWVAVEIPGCYCGLVCFSVQFYYFRFFYFEILLLCAQMFEIITLS